MYINLLRHGETERQEEKRYYGKTDVALSEEGREKLFASGNKPERVYVSGLSRSRQTAEIIYPGAEYIVVPELNEMDFGDFEGKNWYEMKDDPEYQAWVDSECTGRCPGGESKTEFSGRICKAMTELVARETKEGRNEIFIVAHGGTIMASLERFGTDRNGEYYEWLPGYGEGYRIECTWKGTDMQWSVIRRLSYDKSAGRIHLYYGEGRGKTSIAMGTALRALRAGRQVKIVQFCKSKGSGETEQLEKLGAMAYYGKEGAGFVSAMNEAQKKTLKEKQTDLLKEILFAPIPYPEGSLLILDEVCAALEQDVLDEATVWDTVVRKKSPIEIIMTGRHPKGWMLAASDYVTELKEIQHPYHDGLTARAGIEF
ncbi:MAG: cob(I)yrinic acid a,c-diamide adenosyltransferase [Lachnospiraceae bacterium]|nr:cob(I)yrinic acid a,c-diamide adenosyltransferase [Lachnospiraceae bacterium]